MKKSKKIKKSKISKSKVRKKVQKGDVKYRNLLKDPNVLADIEKLFDDLKGSKEDDFVDTSTILFLFNSLDLGKDEPEYFWHIYSQLQNIEKLSKT